MMPFSIAGYTRPAPIHIDETPTRIRVVRPCCIHGRPRKIGEEIELPRWQAQDVIGCGRGERVPDAPTR